MKSIQQRAQSAAKRKNQKIKAAYPLFAKLFAVTVESQIERLEKQEVKNEHYFEKLKQGQLVAYQRGLAYRAIVEQLAPPNDFDNYDKRYQRIYGSRSPEQSGSELADWWWQAAKELIPAWAQEHCPNTHFHEWEIYQRAGTCPTCLSPLTTAPNPPQTAHAQGGRQSSFVS